jgi:hypothetical protein
MDNTLKSGIIAGLAGIPFMFIAVVIFFYAWFSLENSQLSILSPIAAFTLSFLVAGAVAGVLALPSIRMAWGSFLPGLIAGFVTSSIPLSGLLIMTFFYLYQGLGEMSSSWNMRDVRYPLLLCCWRASAWRACVPPCPQRSSFSRESSTVPGPQAAKAGDLESLGTLYDELLEDARTLVADMNQSIAVYRVAGLFLVISGIVLLAYAITGWLNVLGGDIGSFDFIFTMAATLCSLAQLLVGPFFLYWYDKLRKRYVNPTRMEKAAGD